MNNEAKNRHSIYNGFRLQSSKAGDRWTCFINEDYVGIDEGSEGEAVDQAKRRIGPGKTFRVWVREVEYRNEDGSIEGTLCYYDTKADSAQDARWIVTRGLCWVYDTPAEARIGDLVIERIEEAR